MWNSFFCHSLSCIYVITASLLVAVLNISIRKTDYNEIYMYLWLLLRYKIIHFKFINPNLGALFWGLLWGGRGEGGQAFINYNFSYMRFHACKTVLGARLCTSERVDVHVTNNNMAVKNVQNPFLQIILFQLTWWLPSILVHYSIYLHNSVTIFDKLKWEGCSKSNILTMT